MQRFNVSYHIISYQFIAVEHWSSAIKKVPGFGFQKMHICLADRRMWACYHRLNANSLSVKFSRSLLYFMILSEIWTCNEERDRCCTCLPFKIRHCTLSTCNPTRTHHVQYIWKCRNEIVEMKCLTSAQFSNLIEDLANLLNCLNLGGRWISKCLYQTQHDLKQCDTAINRILISAGKRTSKDKGERWRITKGDSMGPAFSHRWGTSWDKHAKLSLYTRWHASLFNIPPFLCSIDSQKIAYTEVQMVECAK